MKYRRKRLHDQPGRRAGFSEGRRDRTCKTRLEGQLGGSQYICGGRLRREGSRADVGRCPKETH